METLERKPLMEWPQGITNPEEYIQPHNINSVIPLAFEFTLAMVSTSDDSDLTVTDIYSVVNQEWIQLVVTESRYVADDDADLISRKAWETTGQFYNPDEYGMEFESALEIGATNAIHANDGTEVGNRLKTVMIALKQIEEANPDVIYGFELTGDWYEVDDAAERLWLGS